VFYIERKEENAELGELLGLAAASDEEGQIKVVWTCRMYR